MFRVSNIISLSEFRHSTKSFIEKIKQSEGPIILTVNGKAEIVVCEANAFQALVDRMEKSEAENQSLRQQLSTSK
jgi:PHD/YefM family antitoxin component YafN of YafNO toxin-antitoxin module